MKKKKNIKNIFIPNKEGIYNINIKFNINLTDCSYMFVGCDNIININFISFNTKNVENMKYMLYGCSNLKYLNLLSFNTKKVIDITHMFESCSNLKYLDLSSFIIKKETNTELMFFLCHLFNNYENLFSINFKELKEFHLMLKKYLI